MVLSSECAVWKKMCLAGFVCLKESTYNPLPTGNSLMNSLGITLYFLGGVCFRAFLKQWVVWKPHSSRVLVWSLSRTTASATGRNRLLGCSVFLFSRLWFFGWMYCWHCVIECLSKFLLLASANLAAQPNMDPASLIGLLCTSLEVLCFAALLLHSSEVHCLILSSDYCLCGISPPWVFGVFWFSCISKKHANRWIDDSCKTLHVIVWVHGVLWSADVSSRMRGCAWQLKLWIQYNPDQDEVYIDVFCHSYLISSDLRSLAGSGLVG